MCEERVCVYVCVRGGCVCVGCVRGGCVYLGRRGENELQCVSDVGGGRVLNSLLARSRGKAKAGKALAPLKMEPSVCLA